MLSKEHRAVPSSTWIHSIVKEKRKEMKREIYGFLSALLGLVMVRARSICEIMSACMPVLGTAELVNVLLIFRPEIDFKNRSTFKLQNENYKVECRSSVGANFRDGIPSSLLVEATLNELIFSRSPDHHPHGYNPILSEEAIKNRLAGRAPNNKHFDGDDCL